MIPPSATAATTAAEVQLEGVPLPTTWFGCEVLIACAALGIDASPFGLPALAIVATGVGVGGGGVVGAGVAEGVGDAEGVALGPVGL